MNKNLYNLLKEWECYIKGDLKLYYDSRGYKDSMIIADIKTTQIMKYIYDVFELEL